MRRHLAHVRGRPRPAIRLAAALSIFLIAISEGAVSARAQVLGEQYIDIALVPCRELVRLPLPQALVLVGWLGGYVAGLRSESRVDRRKFIEGAERVLTQCRENESLPLIEVAKQEFGDP
jgi:hypothetical protein